MKAPFPDYARRPVIAPVEADQAKRPSGFANRVANRAADQEAYGATLTPAKSLQDSLFSGNSARLIPATARTMNLWERLTHTEVDTNWPDPRTGSLAFIDVLSKGDR